MMDDILVAGHVRQLFEEARAKRRPLVERWQRNYRMLFNRYWAEHRADWQPSPALPELWPICSSLVGWMTDQRMRYAATALVEANSDEYTFWDQVAEDMERLLGISYDVNDEEAEYTIALWDAHLYGTGFVKTVWDPTAADGQGDAVTRRVDPFTIFPDPNGTSMKTIDYIAEVRQYSWVELEHRFPGARDKFDSPALESIDQAPTTLDEAKGDRAPKAPIWTRATSAGTTSYGPPRGDRRGGAGETEGGVTVIELWEKDYVDGKEEWTVTVTAGPHVLMNERAKDIWSHGQHPYSRLVLQDLGEFWGQSTVELLIDAQVGVNRILAALQQNVELVGNPVLLEDTTSGISRTKITNRPGQRIQKNRGGDVSWMNPPQVHATMGELLQYYLQRMESISGLQAIVRGQTPRGRNAQGVIDAVQEASFVRIRLALREYERTLRDAGMKKAALIADFYDQPRYLSTLGNEEGQRTHMILRANHFKRSTPDGPLPLEYLIGVDAGSKGLTSRQVEEDKLLTLFTLGAIDEAALLEGIRFPNWQAVQQRVMQMKAQGLLAAPGKRERARR